MTPAPVSTPLLADIRLLIDGARKRVASAVNTELTQLYWHIGRRISTELPPHETLQAKLHLSIELARQKLLNGRKNTNEISLSPCPACVNSYQKSSFQPT